MHVSWVNDNQRGIVSIFMILKYFDIEIDYFEIRDSFNLPKDVLVIKDMLNLK